MGLRIVQVDSFTAIPFAGNPAAVCILSEPRDARWMQNVALEMNLAETAFLVPQDDGFNLRWFTPLVEVDLCGHATLASAHVLWETGQLPADAQARFHTRSGLLLAERKGEWIEMDFPAEVAQESSLPPDLLPALGVNAIKVSKTRFDYLVEVASEEIVRSTKPDISRLAAVDTRGVMVTSRADTAGYDFISRFFAPAVGIPEDPVTGSAHCSLAPYWGRILGKEQMVGYQASPRGGTVRVRLNNDRVILSGQAVTVMHGDLLW